MTDKKEKGLRLKGRMHALLKKPDGRVIEYSKQNMIVDVGYDFVCDCLANGGARPGVMSHLAVGEGLTAADASDTALEDEIGRAAITYQHDSGEKDFTVSCNFAAGVATGDISEAAMLNNSSGGTMVNRVVFSAIPKEADDDLDMSFTFTFDQ